MPKPFIIPGAPQELLDIINARRATIPHGMVMMADQPQADPPKTDSPAGPDADKATEDLGGFKSKLSKDSVLADLAAERQARKDLESKFARVAEAFGVKAEKGNPDDAVAQLTDVVGTIQSQLAVERLARQHKITAEDDIAALMAVSDTAAREKLAARLAPPDDAPDNEPRPRAPKPDSTQGPKGSPAKPDAKPGLPRLTQGVTDALENLI